jgi:hypothetical protein
MLRIWCEMMQVTNFAPNSQYHLNNSGRVVMKVNQTRGTSHYKTCITTIRKKQTYGDAGAKVLRIDVFLLVYCFLIYFLQINYDIRNY